MSDALKIATTLAEATPALQPEMPLESGDPRWTDFEAARGTDSVEILKRLFQRQPKDQWLHVAFASHRGAGKTTELNRLAEQISGRYCAIYFEANGEMDPVNFEIEDLLLVIARVVEAKMREDGSPLPANTLQKVEDFFSEVVFTDEEGKSYLGKVQAEAKLEGGVPFFAKLMASVTSSFQAESKHRQSVKSTLRKFPGTLVELVNGLLDETNKVLAPKQQLLLIVDNFDRYDPKVIDALMVQGADQFKSLRCHVTVTPPIGLVLKPESQTIEAVFRCETMPTMKLRNKDQGYGEFSGPGRDRLLEALGKRIDLDRLMPDPAARDRLVAASGGAIRELLEITQDVTLRADGETMTLADVEAVLSRRRNRLRDRIDANGWWDIIAQIGRTKRLGPDKGFLEVLFQRLAFQYNGEVWYDVHPLIADLPEYASRVNVVQTS